MSKNIQHAPAKGTSHPLNSPLKSIYSMKAAGLHVFLLLKQEHKILIHITYITACIWHDTVDRMALADKTVPFIQYSQTTYTEARHRHIHHKNHEH